MIRWFSVVAPILALTGIVAAQETRPLFFLWDSVSTATTPAVPTTYASQIVRVKVDAYLDGEGYPDGVAAGRACAQKAWDQIAANKTREDAVCLTLQNFGQWIWAPPPNNWAPNPSMVSFLDEDDVLTNVQWIGGTPPLDYRLLQCMQPWMEVGRAKVTLWMEDFIYGYTHLDPPYMNHNAGPPPARAAFDTEVSLALCCLDANAIRIIEAVANDTTRWNDTPVPGFGTQTMADLFATAKANVFVGRS